MERDEKTTKGQKKALELLWASVDGFCGDKREVLSLDVKRLVYPEEGKAIYDFLNVVYRIGKKGSVFADVWLQFFIGPRGGIRFPIYDKDGKFQTKPYHWDVTEVIRLQNYWMPKLPTE